MFCNPSSTSPPRHVTLTHAVSPASDGLDSFLPGCSASCSGLFMIPFPRMMIWQCFQPNKSTQLADRPPLRECADGLQICGTLDLWCTALSYQVSWRMPWTARLDTQPVKIERKKNLIRQSWGMGLLGGQSSRGHPEVTRSPHVTGKRSAVNCGFIPSIISPEAGLKAVLIDGESGRQVQAEIAC